MIRANPMIQWSDVMRVCCKHVDRSLLGRFETLEEDSPESDYVALMGILVSVGSRQLRVYVADEVKGHPLVFSSLTAKLVIDAIRPIQNIVELLEEIEEYREGEEEERDEFPEVD